MIYKLLSTRVYRAYYGGENIDKLTGIQEPQVTRFPEDWIASVTNAFNPGRDVEGEGFINNVSTKVGERFFVSENEKELCINGSLKLLICTP